MPLNYQLRQFFQNNCREQAYFGIEVDCTGLCLCRQISVIQILQHKGTHITKAVYYLCNVDVLVHDSDSKLQFKSTSKKKKKGKMCEARFASLAVLFQVPGKFIHSLHLLLICRA